MVDWITNTLNSLGYVGIGLLMFLENVFPPIPSELIMPLAGFTAAQGKLALFPAILAGSIGSLLGALLWYYIGKFVGEVRLKQWADQYGKWLTLSSADITKADNWFNKYGGLAVFLGRLVPGVRTLISLPAGVSEMPLLPFVLYSALGSTFWVAILTYLGYVLGDNYELVEEYLGPVSKIVVVALAIAFVVWVVWRQSQRKSRR